MEQPLITLQVEMEDAEAEVDKITQVFVQEEFQHKLFQQVEEQM